MMLNYTGERIVPGAKDCEPNFASRMFHEHMARYLFASQQTAGKVILDVGCGVGYGAQRLGSMGAASVTAFDISKEAIEHAKQFYSHPAVSYHVANAETFSFGIKFDVVTCFEVIEHVDRPDVVLANIAKHLKPDGLLVTSTPRHLGEKRTHFHTKEYSLEEFRELIGKHFARCEMYVENNHFSSLITSGPPDGIARVEFLKNQFDLAQADVFIALAIPSPDVDLPKMDASLVVDDDAYVTMLERDVDTLHKAEDDLKEKLAAIEEEAKDVRAFFENEIARLTNEYNVLHQHAADLDKKHWEAEQALEQRLGEIQQLTRERDDLMRRQGPAAELETTMKQAAEEQAGLRSALEALTVRVADADSRRLEALEYARATNDNAQGTRRELEILKRDLAEALESPAAVAEASPADHRHRDIVESMERLFLGTEATHHVARNPLVIKVGRLALELQQSRERQRELEGELERSSLELSQSRERQRELEGELDRHSLELSQSRERQREFEEELAKVRERADHIELHAQDWHNQLLRLRHSASWRMTKPLRWATRPFRR